MNWYRKRGLLAACLALAASRFALGENDSPAPGKAGTDRQGDKLPPGAVVRIGTLRFQHGAFVPTLAFSPDGKLLASGGWDRTICLWDAATGKLLRRLKGHGHIVTSVAFSPDGKALASGAGLADPTVRLWDVVTGEEVHRVQGVGAVEGVAFAPDGRTLAVASADGLVHLLDREGREVRRLAGHRGAVHCVAFAPDGKALVSAGADTTIRLWDPASGKEVRQLQANQSAILAVAFSRDGKWLASGGRDKLIRLWDAAGGVEVRQCAGHEGIVTTLAFSPDGKHLASGGVDAAVRLWAVATGAEARRFPNRHHVLRSAAFSPGGKALAVSDGSAVRLWDPHTARDLAPVVGPEGPVYGVAFSADGSRLALVGRDDVPRLFETATGKEVRRFPGGASWAARLALTPDGRLLITGGLDRTVRLWDTATGKEVRQLQAHQGGTAWVALAREGRELATASFNGEIGLWETGTGRERRRWQAHAGSATAVAFSPDGKSLASGGMWREGHRLFGEVKLWDAATGKLLRTFAGQFAPVDSLALSPDGRMLAAGTTDRTLLLWEVLTGRERLRLKEVDVGTLAFSPDGVLLAAAGRSASIFNVAVREPVIRIWRLDTAREVRALRGHDGGIHALAFSPHGGLLASGSEDNTALLWDVRGLAAERPRQTALSAEVLGALWEALAGDDAARAYRAIRSLTAGAREAVPFLRARLQPAAVGDAARLAQLIADLDSGQFAVRQKATAELKKLGPLAEPALRRALAGRLSDEARRRVQQILEQAAGARLPPEYLRDPRAVEALERIGTPEARQALLELARGAPEARLTQEAQAALRRLAK